MTEGAAASSKKLGLIPCLAFAVGTMVGGGVFTLSGTAINEAGPAALASYLLAGGIMLLSALSFVAVATRAKPGDSGYGPIADLLGQGWRFITMWGFYINGLTILTFLLISFGDYLNQYFLSDLGVTAAALIALGLITALNFGPADLIGKAETYIVALKIALLLFFVFYGLAHFTDIDFTPFAPEGSKGIFKVTALLFTAYTGFNVVTNMAGSLDRPERNIPLAVIGSIFISAAIYVGVILAMLASGVDHFGSAGVGEAADALMGDWGGYLIAFAACLSTLSGANANMLGASEIAMRLVAQGDVPPAVGRTSPSGHPLMSILFMTVVTFVLVLVANSDNIVALANVGALVAMIVVNAAAFRLAQQGWPGVGLRLPFGVLIPVLGILTCVGQFPSLGWREVIVGLLLIASGYALYIARHEQRGGEGIAERITSLIHNLETPLARALRPHFLDR